MGSRFWRTIVLLAIILTIIAGAAAFFLLPIRRLSGRIIIGIVFWVCSYLLYLLRERFE